MALLDVRDLAMAFATPTGDAYAVDRVSFTLERGEVLGLVGESGCGKSMLAFSLLRLVQPPGRIVGGQVLLDGVDLLQLSEHEMRGRRGKALGLIFQEPMTALNPVLTVGSQVAEAVALHGGTSREAAHARAVQLLDEVGLPDARRRAADYPHQLSGGMRQRVMIAIGIACNPQVLIADEPTTALDVTIQADILDLLATLRARYGMAVLLITHDLGVVAEQTDRVAIMYAGRIVETGPTAAIFSQPGHPYTRALLRAMPGLGGRHEQLAVIRGTVPDLLRKPSGCAFRDRCDQAAADCAATRPELAPHGPAHSVACLHP